MQFGRPTESTDHAIGRGSTGGHPTTEQWRTAITEVDDGVIRYRGRPVEDLIEGASVEEVLALLLVGGRPDGDVLDAVRRAVVAAADHGTAAPSIATARICASTRLPLAASVGAGLVAFGGSAHGGAAEACANVLIDVRRAVASGEPVDEAAATCVDEHVRRGERVPGFGHPVHRRDPRVAALLGAPMARDDHRRIARALEAVLLERRSPRLTMNADAAVAALLLDAGLAAPAVTAVTAIGRAIGLAAHATEELDREAPFRAPSPSAITYDGPGSD